MFNKKNDNETKLGAALAEADDVLNERSKIGAAIQKTASEIAAAEADLQKALERLAVEEADVALADAMVESRQTPAQRAVVELRMRLEAQQARLRGLEHRKVGNEDRVRSALDSLTVAMSSWRDAHVAEFRTEYVRAVENFAAVLRKGAALGDAIGASWLSSAMKKAELYDPNDSLTKIVNMDPCRFNTTAGVWDDYPAWEDDPAAKALYDSLAHVRQKEMTLEGIWTAVQRRRDEAARAEQRRRFEAEDRPKAPSYEIYYPLEYSAPPCVEFIEASKSK